MRTLLASTGLCLTISAGFWFALTGTLTDLTMRDCRAGIVAACNQLKQDRTAP